MAKTPNFEERVKKFLPRIYFFEEHADPSSYNVAYFPRISKEDAKKFGFIPQRENYRGELRDYPPERITFGKWRGKTVSWRYHCGEFLGGQCFHDYKPGYPTLTYCDWMICRDYYEQKFEKDSKKLEQENPDYAKLVELTSPRMKGMISDDELKKMRKFYEEKLENNPEYIKLQELKKDVYALRIYTKKLEKERNKEEREGFLKRLKELKTEYDSDGVKASIPSEKKRLSVRGAMHRKLKQQSGL